MSSGPQLNIHQNTVTDTAWVSITAPWPCNNWWIIPQVDVLVCSNPTDTLSQETILASSTYGIDGHYESNDTTITRCGRGDVLIYVKCVKKNTSSIVTLRCLKPHV